MSTKTEAEWLASPRMPRTSLRRVLGNLFVAAVFIVSLIWVLFPLYWTFLNSIKNPAESFGASWIPFVQFTPTLRFWRAMLDLPEVRRAILNSLAISVGGASIALVLGTLAAYGLARFRFERPSNSSITTWFLSQRVLPPVIFVTPFYLLARQFGLLDSVWPLIILNGLFTLAFPVIILTQMFREVPIELEEAAEVDGATRWEMFARISLPLVAPGLVVSWIIALAFSWNEYLLASTLTQNQAMPIPIIIAGAETTRGVDYQFIGTRVMLAILPPTIMALLAQRYIIRGLSFGAVKG